MKYFQLALAASLICCGSAQGSVTPVKDWRMCDGCSVSQMQQCAIEVATVEGLQTGDHVWIFDFENWIASNYYLEVTPPGTPIQGEVSRDDQQLTQVGLVVANAQTLSAREVELSEGLFGMVEEVWRPMGWGYHYEACADSTQYSLKERGGPKEPIAIIQHQPRPTPITIPPGSDQNSAHDIIGNQARALQLAQAHSGGVGVPGQIQNWVGNDVRVAPINTRASKLFQFSDGSSAIWNFNVETDRWEPDWATFEDSDGNPIPLSANDAPPGAGFEFSGTAEGERNLQQFLDRMTVFGIPIAGPGDDGVGGSPVRCEVTSDGLRCWYSSV